MTTTHVSDDQNQMTDVSAVHEQAVSAECVDQKPEECSDTKSLGSPKGRRVVSSKAEGSVLLRYAPQVPPMTESDSSASS